MKKSAFESLLHEAVTAGAVDRWMEDENRYHFCIGSRIFRMKRDDGTVFLEALLQRQHLESLRVRGIADELGPVARVR